MDFQSLVNSRWFYVDIGRRRQHRRQMGANDCFHVWSSNHVPNIVWLAGGPKSRLSDKSQRNRNILRYEISANEYHQRHSRVQRDGHRQLGLFGRGLWRA